MSEETGYFSSFDGTKLFYRAWGKESISSLIIVHGFGEHSGRYHELVEALSKLPISIFAHDLRGHGHSEGERVFAGAFDDFTKDLYAFRTFIEDKKKGNSKDFVLLGQSFGGLIATAAALNDQAKWKALILLSPFFGVPRGYLVLETLSSFLSLIAPKTIWSNPIKPIFLTHDLEELERYKRDSLIQRRITMQLAREMFRGCSAINARAKEIVLPFLLLIGGSDRIVSVESAEMFLKRTSSESKEIQIFDGLYHELLHETARDKTISRIKDYLSRFSD